jgi:ATP phosphoribosyltransferase
VETGATLQANGLVEMEELMISTAQVIANRAAWRLRTPEIQHLLERLEDPH